MEKKISMSKSFIETFEPIMTKNGFARKDKNFHRLVNGKIVQTMSYKSYHMSTQFTVNFSILPLCGGHEYTSSYIDAERMDTTFFGKVPCWDYERAGAYVEYMPTALKAVEEYLLPRFNALVDYKSYREAQDFSRNKFSYLNYKLALVFENYQLAQESREAYFEHWHTANRNNQQILGDKFFIPAQRQEQFDQVCKDYYRMKEAMDKGDRKTIEEYIHELEQKSLNSYIKTFFSQKKYEKYQETGILPFESVNICPTT